MSGPTHALTTNEDGYVAEMGHDTKFAQLPPINEQGVAVSECDGNPPHWANWPTDDSDHEEDERERRPWEQWEEKQG